MPSYQYEKSHCGDKTVVMCQCIASLSTLLGIINNCFIVNDVKRTYVWYSMPICRCLNLLFDIPADIGGWKIFFHMCNHDLIELTQFEWRPKRISHMLNSRKCLTNLKRIIWQMSRLQRFKYDSQSVIPTDIQCMMNGSQVSANLPLLMDL